MNANTPVIVTNEAPLPARYEAARKALAECVEIDELKAWTDKAAALASYARQAKDSSLHMMALRIQARAQRRCGELLKQIPEQRGGDRGNSATGGRLPVGETRTSVARAAGLSDHQRKTAVRVSNVPEDAFESQVESESPPTVAALAQQGKANPPSDPDRKLARCARAALAAFGRACARLDPRAAAQCFRGTEAESVRNHVRAADCWLDVFVTNLPTEE